MQSNPGLQSVVVQQTRSDSAQDGSQVVAVADVKQHRARAGSHLAPLHTRPVALQYVEDGPASDASTGSVGPAASGSGSTRRASSTPPS